MISKFERLCLKSICVIRSIDCIVFTGETSDMLETHENISYTNVQRSFKGTTGSYYVSKHHDIFLLRRAGRVVCWSYQSADTYDTQPRSPRVASAILRPFHRRLLWQHPSSSIVAPYMLGSLWSISRSIFVLVSFTTCVCVWVCSMFWVCLWRTCCHWGILCGLRFHYGRSITRGILMN